MAFVPIDSSYLKPALDELCELLSKSVGPRGSLSLLTLSGGALALTSSSSRIATNLPVRCPILRFALQSIESQTFRCGDGGLYCGIILSKVLSNLISNPSILQVACRILSRFSFFIHEEFQSTEYLRIKTNLDSVKPLLAVARSVLFSKCGIFGGKYFDTISENNRLVSLLVRAFLLSEASIEKVLFSVDPNSERNSLLNGILYSCSDGEDSVICNQPWHSVSVLLFSTMLTDRLDANQKNLPGIDLLQVGVLQMKAAQAFIEKAIDCGIKVIACQKVVHPLLLLKLRRCGILVLQRLGRRKAEAIEILSGAVPISTLLKSSLDVLSSLKGTFRCVRPVQEVGEDFILLEGEPTSGICSLVLKSRSLQSSEEIKVVSHQVLSSLSRAVGDGAVCPGAGCSEMVLCFSLWKKVVSESENLCESIGCSTTQLRTVLRWSQEALLQAAGLNWKGGSLAADSVYYHAWEGSDTSSTLVNYEKCNCGLVSKDDVLQVDGTWTIITFSGSGVFSSDKAFQIMPPPFLSADAQENVIFDVCSTKKGAVTQALDTCIALSNIGAVIVSTE